MDSLTVNNTGRVVMALVFLLAFTGLFFYLTFYGSPTNALHSWAQSASLTVAVGILACLAGFKPLADFASTFRK